MSFRLAAMRRRSTVRPMQDRELVAAIVNGESDGLAEAFDRYAVSLYAYCRAVLPDPHPPDEAADAVADTFTIATAKLQGLRDPDQLGSWLHAVARNECLRRGGAAGLAADGAAGLAADGAAGLAADGAAGLAADDAAGLAADGAAPEVGPPDGLRERVLQTGADNTPTGRAHRVSVTYRAGTFGRTGFPKPIVAPGPRWWHEVRRRPRAATAVAALAVAVVAAGVPPPLGPGRGPPPPPPPTRRPGRGPFAAAPPPPRPPRPATPPPP